jgi:ribonucleoside-diphosphate reductase alpha chain
VTLLPPTGTISFIMDCDTTGVEPDFALVKEKQLAGGGSMRIVNQAVPEALCRLEYADVDILSMLEWIEVHGALPVKDDERPGMPRCILSGERTIFACAGDIAPEDHVRMVAAVQPFLSGGVSKTVNMSNGATVDDVDRVYRLAASLGLKSISVYRDGSKLSQPLSAGKTMGQNSPDYLSQDRVRDGGVTWVREPIHGSPRTPDDFQGVTAGETAISKLARGEREYLPWRRDCGWTQKIKIGEHGQSVYLRVSEYPDGRPGEVFLEIAGEGSTLRALANCLAISISMGLQRGVPVAEYVDQFVGTKFEPAGAVEGHDRIRFASSIADYIGKELGISYAGRDDLAPPPRPPIEESVALIAEATERADVDAAWQAVSGSKVAAYRPKIADTSVFRGHAATSPWRLTGDLCPKCGSLLRRNGTCRSCSNCGYDEGCSG